MIDFHVFESFFKYSPIPSIVFLPQKHGFTVFQVNDAYLSATHTSIELLIGKKIEEAFPPIQSDYVARVVLSLSKVLEEKEIIGIENLSYLITDIASQKEVFSNFSAKNTPIKNDAGEIVAIIHSIEPIKQANKGIKINEDLEAKADTINSKQSITTEIRQERVHDKEIVWEWNLATDHIIVGENYYTLFEYPYEEKSISSQQWKENIHPSDAERVLNGINTAIANAKNTWHEAYRLKKGSGEYAYVENRVFFFRNEEGNLVKMMGMMCDCSHIKSEHDRLKLLESVIVNLNDSILITEAEPFDLPGPKIIYANAAFEKMSGYSLDEIIGQTPRLLQGEKTDRNELIRLGNALRNWKSCEVTLINYKKSGEEFWLNFTVTPVADENGWFTHWIAIERDVTEIVQSKKYLEKLNAQLKQKADELSMSNKELEQFAYIASHDLQEPLRMITGFLSQIEKKYGNLLDDVGKQYIHFAVDGAARMRQIILDLLAYSRIGRIDETKQDLDLNNLIDDLKILFQQKIIETQAVIKVDKLPTLHLSKVPMRQVFQNLIGNSLKYSKKGIPTQIDISVKEHNYEWEFWVQDNGIGIEKAYYEKVFLIFQRLHAKEAYDGTGLGLAVTKKVIESLGGKIWLESEIGIGSTFIFTIPKYQTVNTQ